MPKRSVSRESSPSSGKSKKRPAQNPIEDEEEDYEVERIRDHHWDLCKPNDVRYLVKWKNYPETDNTWEPEENLSGAPELLRKYRSKCNMSAVAQMFPKIQEQVVAAGCSLVAAISDGKSGQDVKLKIKIDKTKAQAVLKEKLKASEAEIQKLCEQTGEAKIYLENEVDYELLPEDFTWITENKAGKGVTIPNDPPLHCSCASSGRACGKPAPGERLKPTEKCCPGSNDLKFPYDENGRLVVQNRDALYECNKNCTCDDSCMNRVVQKGRKFELSIFRTPNKGWGVKTLVPIPKGSFVAEYLGEIITDEEAERRGKTYDAEGATYLFDLDFSDSDAPYTVDAKYYGNFTHFINHSCSPNMTTKAVYINCLEPDLARLAFFSRRDIKAGEELSFNYCITDNDDDESSEGTVSEQHLMQSGNSSRSEEGASVETSPTIVSTATPVIGPGLNQVLFNSPSQIKKSTLQLDATQAIESKAELEEATKKTKEQVEKELHLERIKDLTKELRFIAKTDWMYPEPDVLIGIKK